jgi:uncharacterized membrane protein YgcG
MARMPTARRLLTALAVTLIAGGIVGIPAAADARSGTQPDARSDAAAGPAPVAALDASGLPTSATGVDDFSFDSFDAVYTLGRDSAERSTLTTTETLVAEFPAIDQNRGIIRAIPGDYHGHPTDIHVTSVTDGNGYPRSYDTSFDSGLYNITIAVPKGQYVHGAQTYVISYTQQDVTDYFADTGDDEFYWDVNGTGWPQPFGEVSAKVTLSPELGSALNGKTACYYGYQGSTQTCQIVTAGTGATSSFSASVTKLAAYENLTVSIGFTKGTFAVASSNPLRYLSPLPIIGAAAAVLAFLIGLFLPLTWRAKGTGIVIAQYEPPAGVSAILAANIIRQAKRGFAASIVDLAVRGTLKLHVRKSGLFGTGQQFGVQPLGDGAIEAAGLDEDERSIHLALSYGDAEDGVVWLHKNDTRLGTFVQALTKVIASEAVDRGLRRKPSRLPALIVFVLMAVGVALSAISVAHATDNIASVSGIVVIMATIVLGVFALRRVGGARPLTREGKLLEEHLEGLKLYIRFAEADRLKMLQSVTGAERIDTTDAGQIVKIYERLLPYATLFGLEEQWAGELGKYYAANPPGWYDGGNLGAFSVGYFAGSIGSFGASVANSYSGSASSSGGSGGGGFSGGGGGGGGGGGI